MAVVIPRTAARARARRPGRVIMIALIYVGLAIGTILFLGPMIWGAISSLKTEDQLYTTFLPSPFTTEAYTDSFKAIPNIGRVFFNSVFDYGIVTIGALVFSSMAGYALARLQFLGRGFLFNLILFTMTIPSMLTLVPLYILIADFFDWGDTYQAIIAPALVSPLGIFLFRQFFRTLPVELFEAGRLDGLSDLGMLFRIAWPLSRGAIVTVAVLVFMTGWDDFLWPLVVEHDQNYQTATQAVGLFVRGGASNGYLTWQLAMATILALPVLAIFIFGQRYFVEGIATTGLK
ncbi:MAG: carbohydrate ABC transporter permease [Chloroflexota bacterium]